jgi:hypothetical protein
MIGEQRDGRPGDGENRDDAGEIAQARQPCERLAPGKTAVDGQEDDEEQKHRRQHLEQRHTVFVEQAVHPDRGEDEEHHHLGGEPDAPRDAGPLAFAPAGAWLVFALRPISPQKAHRPAPLPFSGSAGS